MDEYIWDWEVWDGDEFVGWTCQAYADEVLETGYGYRVVRPERCRE